MRTCIKCKRELPLGMFDDNWRHKVNICKDCYKAIRIKSPKWLQEKDVKCGSNS